MNPTKIRFRKEFRPLLMPWGLAALAAAAAPVKLMLEEAMHPGEFWTMMLGLIPFTFFGSMVALGASSFGAEFQHRTLPLLMTQPLQRLRMWNEKFAVLAGAALSVVLIYFAVGLGTSLVTIGWAGAPRAFLTTEQTLLIGVFLLMTVCSAGFWTLQARSILGGMTFCIAMQFFLVIVVNLVLERIYHNKVGGLEDAIVLRWIVVTGAVYSGAFLWLGWRKFAGFQLKAVGPGDGESLGIRGTLAGVFSPAEGDKESLAWRVRRMTEEFFSRHSGWLRCRPESATLNLIRKELRLQKPLFVIAAVLTLCWMATVALLLMATTTDWQDIYKGALNVLTVVWVVLLAVLAGCVSLGEDKSMRVAEWQLTLPVSARRLWFAKLGVSGLVGVLLGIGLPLVLALLTSLEQLADTNGFGLSAAKVGLVFLVSDTGSGARWFFGIWAMIFVLGFWAATLLGTIVRATLNAAVMMVCLGVVASLGAGCLTQFHIRGLERSLLLPVIVRLQLPTDVFRTEWLILIPFVSGPVMVAALWQSLSQFKRAQVRRWLVWKYSISLLAVAFLMAVWATDIVTSWVSAGSDLNAQLVRAVRSLPISLDELKPSVRKISIKELEDTGQLSPDAREWLRAATVKLAAETPKGLTSRSQMPVIWSIQVTFPNGRQFNNLHVTGMLHDQ